MKIQKTPAAEEDLIEIWIYTAKQWGTEQADAYLDLIESALARAILYPESGTDSSDVRPGYRRIPVGSHRIYYRLDENVLEVVRILHTSREAGLHLED